MDEVFLAVSQSLVSQAIAGSRVARCVGIHTPQEKEVVRQHHSLEGMIDNDLVQNSKDLRRVQLVEKHDLLHPGDSLGQVKNRPKEVLQSGDVQVRMKQKSVEHACHWALKKLASVAVAELLLICVMFSFRSPS